VVVALKHCMLLRVPKLVKLARFNFVFSCQHDMSKDLYLIDKLLKV